MRQVEATKLRMEPVARGDRARARAWAGLFWFLFVTGRTSLYLSTRTSWLVPTGAAILTVAAIGRLATARAATTEPLEPRRRGRSA